MMSTVTTSPLSRETIYAEVRLNQQLRRLENEGGIGWPLTIGIAASIALHCSLLIPQVRDMLLSAAFSNSSENKTRQAAFSVEKEMEKPPQLTPEEEEELTKLGIEDGTTKSTMTWIGYKDYQEHLAKLSQVDQAAFRETDSGGQPMQAQPEQQPSPAAQAQSQSSPSAANPPSASAVAQAAAPPATNAPAPTAPAPPNPETQTKQTTQAVAPPPMPSSLALPETPKVSKPVENAPIAEERKIEDRVLPVERVGDAKDPLVPPEPLKRDAPPPPDQKPTDQKPNDLKPNEAKPSEAKPEETKPAEAQPAAKPEEAKPQDQPPAPQQPTTPASPPTQQQPANSASPPTQPSPEQTQQAATPPADPSQQQQASQPGSKPGPKSNGELSDRESEASSTVNVPQSQWRNGRPLAAKGLNVRTQRPIFDELTSVSTAPENPVIEIEFDRDGVPKKCTIIQSSGTPLVDQPILDCLYRWRASGSPLTKLPEGKTMKFRIRMLLR